MWFCGLVELEWWFLGISGEYLFDFVVVGFAEWSF